MHIRIQGNGKMHPAISRAAIKISPIQSQAATLRHKSWSGTGRDGQIPVAHESSPPTHIYTLERTRYVPKELCPHFGIAGRIE